jgi:outer membrane autotransporter protein
VLLRDLILGNSHPITTTLVGNNGPSGYVMQQVGEQGRYLSGRAGVASVNSTVTREALIGNTTQNLGAEHTDTLWSAYAESGYVLALSGSSRLTPYAGVAYDCLKRGGFTESGGVFGLTAGSQAYQQTAGLLGMRGDTTFQWAGGTSVLQAYAAWQHAFNDGNLDFNAAYVGAPAAGFTVQGIGLARSSGWLGLGLNTAVACAIMCWRWVCDSNWIEMPGGLPTIGVAGGGGYSA